MSKESHYKQILKALLSGKSLTTYEIFAKFRCVDGRKRLSEINQVHRLKKEKVSKNGKNFLRYSIPLCLAFCILLSGCGNEKGRVTICTCEQLEKVGKFVTDNIQSANNMSDEEMEDVITQLEDTGMKIYCQQRTIEINHHGNPDWEVVKLDSCESYFYVPK